MNKTVTLLLSMAALTASAISQTAPVPEPAPLPRDPNARSETTKEFRAGKVGTTGASALETRAKLIALHAAMGADPATVRGVPLKLTVTSLARRGAGLVYLGTDANGRKFAVVSRTAGLEAGQAINGLFEPDGIYEAAAEGGKPAEKMPLYRECAAGTASAALTQAELVTRLKAGQTFKIPMLEKGACEPCFGRGKMSALKGGGRCEACGGSGNALVVYTLKW